MKRIAIVGGGIAGLTAAYELARLARDGAEVQAVLFEASARFGGIVETVREGGFTVECGPDAWLSAKPWARELAIELGLESELIGSNDAERRTHIFLPTLRNPSGGLVAIPDGFHMMVPTDLEALEGSLLLTPAATAAYRAEPGRAAELLASIPARDESVAEFTLRHFGPEVLDRVAAPLLSGIFGGDVHKLSVRAVMPAFVAMEREHGSLITAMQRRMNDEKRTGPIFTTLRSGLGTLVDRLVAAIPAKWLRLQTSVNEIVAAAPGLHGSGSTRQARWNLITSTTGKGAASESFDEVFFAAPIHVARRLVSSVDRRAAELLPTQASSAVLVAFAYSDAARVPVPPGFGFLVPPPHPALITGSRRSAGADGRQYGDFSSVPSEPLLMACTFADQKFCDRAPAGGRLIRAYYGGLSFRPVARCNNDEIAAIARLELSRILNSGTPGPGPAAIPPPPAVLTVVRRWHQSLPQYFVGHQERAAEFRERLRALQGLTLLGNSLEGVGLPDLIRAARDAARTASGAS